MKIEDLSLNFGGRQILKHLLFIPTSFMKSAKHIREEVITVLALVFTLALTSSYITPERFKNAVFSEIAPTSNFNP